MSVSAVTPWLIRPLQQERALVLGVLASIALHMLVLLGLSTGDAPAPPARTLPVLTARLAPMALPPPTVKPTPEAPPAPAPLAVPEQPAPPAAAQSAPKLKLESRPAPAPVPRKSATQPVPTARKPAPPSPKAPPVVAAPPAPSESVPAASEAAVSQSQAAAVLQAKSAPRASAGAASKANARIGNEADQGMLEQYRLALIAATRRYKRYPAIAMEKGWQGRVEVSMVIGANGMLARASIKTSSGHEILDKQAIDMLRKGKTTVQIPSRLRGREFSIDVPVIFNLDDPSS